MRIRTPTGDDIADLADWIEANIVVLGRRRLSQAAMRRDLATLLALDAETAEVLAELVCQEISRRKGIGGAGYPFTERDSAIIADTTEGTLPYKFLLCLSTSEPFRTARRWPETDELFDTLAAQALRCYLGPDSRSVRFGWPPSGDRPTDFRDAIRWLCAVLEVNPGAGRALPTTNDGGLDIVAWKPLHPSAQGFLVLLAQCTVQLEWPSKAKDIRELLILGWIDLGTIPLTALVVPFVIPHAFPKTDALHRNVTLTLDRLRLAHLIGVHDLDQRERIAQWTGNELARMAE